VIPLQTNPDVIVHRAVQDDGVVAVGVEVGQELDAPAVLEVGLQVAEGDPRLDGKEELRIGPAQEGQEGGDIETLQLGIAGLFPARYSASVPWPSRKNRR
jgi:hypothetical protein